MSKQSKTVVDLADKVTAQIAKLGPSVEEGLIEARVERELNKRVSALDQIWEQHERMQKERRKMRPDVVSYGPDKEDGSIGDRIEAWSEKAVQSRKKLDEDIAKIEKIIAHALESGDFTEVYKRTDSKAKPTAESNNSQD